jgi:hypothetical protein
MWRVGACECVLASGTRIGVSAVAKYGGRVREVEVDETDGVSAGGGDRSAKRSARDSSAAVLV